MRLAAALLLVAVAVALVFVRGGPQPQPRAPMTTPAPDVPRAEPGTPALTLGDILALREDRQRAIAAVPELLRIVASGDLGGRVRVAAAVTLHDREEALRVLVAALEEEDEVAKDAAFWIARIGKGAAPVEDELRRYTGSQKDMVGHYVKRALAAIEDDRAAKR